MGPTHFVDVSGLCNLDAMLETYSLSADRSILDRALEAISRPEVVTSFQAWRDGNLISGHMVITYENIRLPVLLYPWSEDESQLQATLGAFKWLKTNHDLPYRSRSLPQNRNLRRRSRNVVALLAVPDPGREDLRR
jgi:hypothetical protein